MKFLIAFVFLTQQFVFGQKKGIDFLPLDNEIFHVRLNSVTYKFSVS